LEAARKNNYNGMGLGNDRCFQSGSRKSAASRMIFQDGKYGGLRLMWWGVREETSRK